MMRDNIDLSWSLAFPKGGQECEKSFTEPFSHLQLVNPTPTNCQSTPFLVRFSNWLESLESLRSVGWGTWLPPSKLTFCTGWESPPLPRSARESTGRVGWRHRGAARRWNTACSSPANVTFLKHTLNKIGKADFRLTQHCNMRILRIITTTVRRMSRILQSRRSCQLARRGKPPTIPLDLQECQDEGQNNNNNNSNNARMRVNNRRMRKFYQI